MAKLRKIFASAVMFTMVLSLCVVAAPVKAATGGDLIKMNGLSSIYYLGGDGKRYVFPNETTYFSWYSDFSTVKTIAQSELESYPLGKNVTIRPGTKLVKITTNPKVYAVTTGGTLIAVPDQATAEALYGSNWNKRIVDVPDAFFTNYTIGSGTVSSTAYPAGSLIKTPSAADVYYIGSDGKAQKITTEAAFNANRFQWSNVITTASSFVLPAAGADLAAANATITDTSSGAGGTAGAGTGLTVALSSTTAPSSTVIVGQASANLGSFNLTASNDGTVNATTIKLKRTGISADTTLSAVYLYEGTTRITDSASVSSGYITWNNSAGIITVPAGQTKTITVKADLAGTAGETVGVSINAASDIVTNGASISGAFPVSANQMSVAAATLATVAFGTPTPTGTSNTIASGEADYSIWKSSVTVGNRAVNMSSIRFRQIGSIAAADIKDFKLFVDGVQKGSTAQMNSNYISFDLSSAPVKLDTGTRIIEVRATLVDGATRTFSLSLQYAVDVIVVDSEYGANVKATGIPATGGTFTVDSGTLSVTKTTESPSGNVTKDASGVTLAKYEFKASGEPVKVEYLRVNVTSSDGSIAKLRNGALFANGVQIGSTADIQEDSATPAYTDYNLGSSLIVTPGTPVVVEVRADIYDSDGTNDVTNGDQFTVNLKARTQTGQLQNSLSYITVPSSDTPASQVTVAVGSMTLNKLASYGDQTTTVPQTSAYKLGEFVLTGNSTEAVNVNTIEVGYIASGTFTTADLTDVYLTYNGKTGSTKATVSGTSTWSVNESLPVNGSMIVAVYGKIGSDITTMDSIKTNMHITGLTSQSSATADSGYATGQVIAKGTGSITSALDASSPVAANVKAGTVDTKAATYKFTTSNDAYTITEVVVKVGAAGASTISKVVLKDGTTVLGTQYINGTSATFGGLNVAVSANSTKKLDVYLDLGAVGTGAGTSGADAAITLDSFKSKPSSGTESSDGTDRAGNSLYVYKAVPTLASQNLPNTSLIAGTNSIAKFSVAGDGTISWKKAVFTIATSSDINTISNVKLYDANTNEEIAGAATVAATSITFVATNEQEVSGSKTYVLKATIGGTATFGADDYITTSIATSASSHGAPAAYSSATGSFIWSDEAVSGHSESTADWTGDWLVKALPLDSQTLTR